MRASPPSEHLFSFLNSHCRRAIPYKVKLLLPESGRIADIGGCLICAISGHWLSRNHQRQWGRLSKLLCGTFLDFAGVGADEGILDVGCGTRSLEQVALSRIGQ